MKTLKEVLAETSEDPSVQRLGRMIFALGLTAVYWLASGGYRAWMDRLLEEKTRRDRERDEKAVVTDTDRAAADADAAASEIDRL